MKRWVLRTERWRGRDLSVTVFVCDCRKKIGPLDSVCSGCGGAVLFRGETALPDDIATRYRKLEEEERAAGKRP